MRTVKYDLRGVSRYNRKIWKWQKDLDYRLPDKKQCMTCRNLRKIYVEKDAPNLRISVATCEINH